MAAVIGYITGNRGMASRTGSKDSTALRSIAFGLLSEKMQATLLVRARKIVGVS